MNWGIEAIRDIKSSYSGTKVLILTMHREREYIRQGIAPGANGYVLKDDADRELFSAIEKIRQGRTYISPKLAEDLAADWACMQKEDFKPSYEPELLTTREREVLKLIAEGRSNKEIASLLFISIRTVDRHRANIMDKLNLKKTADLIRYAIRKNYV